MNKRTPDTQYKDLLQEILDKGVVVKSQQGVDAIRYVAPKPLHFKFENGFPIITERNMDPEKMKVPIWQQAIGEIIGFINGARTLEELESYGCSWWSPWGTEAKCRKRGLETGDLGPGSYGAAFHDFPTAEGEKFNQFEFLVRQIKEQPQLRTHFVTPWIPQYIYRVEGRQQKVVVCPCHGWVHVLVNDNKLTLHMFQRSGDVPVGVPANFVQYSALALMLAKATGLEPYEYIHSLSDAHIYVDQVDAAKEMIAREARVLPDLVLDTDKTDLFAFRREDFKLKNYNPHPGIKKIPVAI